MGPYFKGDDSKSLSDYLNFVQGDMEYGKKLQQNAF